MHTKEAVFELRDEIWQLIWTWRAIEPERAQAWVHNQFVAGTWTRLDVAARMISARAPVGVPNPVWRIGELDLAAVEDLVGTDSLIKEVGEEKILATAPAEMREEIATRDTRRAYEIQMLRRQIAGRETTTD